MQVRCIAELTDTFIFVLRHPGLAQIISIDGCNARRLERMTLLTTTHDKAAMSAGNAFHGTVFRF